MAVAGQMVLALALVWADARTARATLPPRKVQVLVSRHAYVYMYIYVCVSLCVYYLSKYSVGENCCNGVLLDHESE